MKKKPHKKSFFINIIATAIIVTFAMLTILESDSFSKTAKKDTNVQEADSRKIIYWRAPMDPMEIYDEPGKSKMGMDLVPVYEDDTVDDSDSKERKIVYWRAPMDPAEIYEKPGKSKMGMDLVPVYEDEIMGGVDIKIDPVVEQNMGLKTEQVQKGPLEHVIKTYGHITFDETRIGIVSQKFDGWIEKLYADYTGYYVKKDDPLYEIYSPMLLSAQEEYLSAYKNYKKNKTSFNYEILKSSRIRLKYFDIADREIKSIEKNQKIKKSIIIRSPFTGVVTHKNAVEGAFVKTGTSLYTISDLSHVWVEAHIFEYEQNLVFKGQEVEMTLSYNPDKIYRGKIAYIFPYLQQKTRDIVIRIDFVNQKSELKPDMFAKIRIKINMDNEITYISSQAVIHSGEKNIVFVSKGKGKYSPRSITTGIHLDGGKVQVLSGLIKDEVIVTSGQFLLDSESKLREAVQKMIKARSKPVPEEKDEKDDFFDDMESKDDFFKDME